MHRQRTFCHWRVLAAALAIGLCRLISLVLLDGADRGWVCDVSAPPTPWEDFNDVPGPGQLGDAGDCSTPPGTCEPTTRDLTASVYTHDLSKYALLVVKALQERFSVTVYHQSVEQSVEQIIQTAIHLRVELDASILAVARWPTKEVPHVFVALGNTIYPQFRGFGMLNLYMCQFPYDQGRQDLANLQSYHYILLNSQFTLGHYHLLIQPGISHFLHAGWMMPSIEVVYPPVTLPGGLANATRGTNIALIGHFFQGKRSSNGHMTALRIFRRMLPGLPDTTKLILAGQQVSGFGEYVHSLRGYVAHHSLGDRVVFLVSHAYDEILSVLHTAMVQWHLASMESIGLADPASLKHFSISIVEGMSAGVLPVALDHGGLEDIIQHAQCGFLASNANEVMKFTARLFEMSDEERGTWSKRAVTRAQSFDFGAFSARLNSVVADGMMHRRYRFFVGHQLPALRKCQGVMQLAGDPSTSSFAAALIEGGYSNLVEFSARNTMAMLQASSVGSWSLHVFYTRFNSCQVMHTFQAQGFVQTQLHMVDSPGLDAHVINALLKTPEFWQSFGVHVQRVLFLRPESLMLRPGIAHFIEFEYIAATLSPLDMRWPQLSARTSGTVVGYGWFSLHDPRLMAKLAREGTLRYGDTSWWADEPERVFFSTQLANSVHIPPQEDVGNSNRQVQPGMLETTSQLPRPMHQLWHTIDLQLLTKYVRVAMAGAHAVSAEAAGGDRTLGHSPDLFF